MVAKSNFSTKINSNLDSKVHEQSFLLSMNYFDQGSKLRFLRSNTASWYLMTLYNLFTFEKLSSHHIRLVFQLGNFKLEENSPVKFNKPQ